MTTPVELIQVLGMDPYVLVELVRSPDGDPDPTVRLRAGGGLAGDEEVAAALWIGDFLALHAPEGVAA